MSEDLWTNFWTKDLKEAQENQNKLQEINTWLQTCPFDIMEQLQENVEETIKKEREAIRKELAERYSPWTVLTKEGADLILKNLSKIDPWVKNCPLEVEEIFHSNILNAIRRDLGKAMMRKEKIPGGYAP